MGRKNKFNTKKQRDKYVSYREINEQKRKKIFVIRDLIKANKYALAKEVIEEYKEKYGVDDYLIHEEGKYYAKNNDIDEARQLFNRVIDNNKININYSMYELAKLERENANYNEAYDLLDKIISSNHENKEHAYLELAKLYMDTDNLMFAREILNKIINENMPNKEYAFQSMIDLELLCEDIEAAKKYFEIAKNNLRPIDRIFYEANILFIQKKFKSAERILNGTDIEIGRNRLLLCRIEYELKKFDRVIELADINIKYNNKHKRNTIILLCNAFIKEKRETEALDCIEKLKEYKNPEYNQIYYLSGYLYHHLNDFTTARAFYAKIDDSNLFLKQCAATSEINMLICEKRYIEAFDFLKKNENLLMTNMSKFCHIVELFLRKKLNLKNLEPTMYSEKQILNFNKKIALDHIKRHCHDEREELTHSLFNENFNIDELYDEIGEKLSEEYLYQSDIFDSYMIPYKNASASTEEKCNFIKAVVIPETRNIITMYPVSFYMENSKVKKKTKE